MTEAGNTIITDYLTGGFQYSNSFLQFFPHAEGYVTNVLTSTDCPTCRFKPFYSLNYVFNYTDHLGNVRLSYAQESGALKILEENNYYPFGLKHTRNNVNSKMFVETNGTTSLQTIGELTSNTTYFKNNYKYNGKELQDELGLNMYDYGARNYDPALGRWMNIDPLAEKRLNKTPYNYCSNNPINRIDPTGMIDGEVKPKTESNYSITYKGKGNYTMTEVKKTIIENQNEDGSTTTSTTTVTTKINYRMAKDKDGNAVMKVRGGSVNTNATESTTSRTPYQGPMLGGGSMSELTRTLADVNKPLDVNNASSVLKSNDNLTTISKGIEGYHQVNGIDHNIFMDPKNSGISPWVPIGASGVFQALSKYAPVGNGANWAGIIAGAIQAGVDSYYGGDIEKNVGRTAVINLITKDGK